MLLIPIVEGHGEEKAVPILLQKLLHELHGLDLGATPTLPDWARDDETPAS